MKYIAIINGYKTYILSIFGILTALVAHFFGPCDLGFITIPAMTTSGMMHLIWHSAIVAALRHGIEEKLNIPAK